ncbi:alpha/beta hydrolase [Flavobacteriaceae bacterium XHP0103]|uniref:alpha/beta hydrolase n=1 Tax=Marixanthotalea marina TaxID=2844359 RepID=UPI002989C880|nr:alpha/beta hydrolase [Marixanthotalea marina]MBU3821689.1 alpha/beta hydrolase [Marixanthotalea marina]
MKTISTFFLISIFMFSSTSYSQTNYTVTVDEINNGKIKIEPPLPTDNKVPAGTTLKITAIPDEGFTLDAGYYFGKGGWGNMYFETMTSPFEIMIDDDKRIGVSFIEATEVNHLNVTHNVVYAKPGVKDLKYDVFSPKGAENLPCIIIIHGGGWATNNEDVMRGMARELTKSGKYVVFSMDYRWSGKLDGDTIGNTMADIIGDVFGGIAHIMEHAKAYGGDPNNIAVTGDSAGGHLSAVAANMTDKIGDGGFGKTIGVFEFIPSYIPKGKTVANVKTEMMKAIKAAAPSYGVFNANRLNTYSENPEADDSWKKAIAPLSNIPQATDRYIPQYLTRGTNDFLIKDQDVKEYTEALVKAGQRVEYIQIGGAGHAFFDWKPDTPTKSTFKKYGVYYCKQMELFFDSVFYTE